MESIDGDVSPRAASIIALPPQGLILAASANIQQASRCLRVPTIRRPTRDERCATADLVRGDGVQPQKLAGYVPKDPHARHPVIARIGV